MDHEALILAPDTTSFSTIAPGPSQAPEPILTPGNMETLIPALTPSPRIAPSFLLLLATSAPRTLDFTLALSNLRFAVIVPAPSEHPSPSMLSPTYERLGIFVSAMMMLFFTSQAAPTFTFSPRDEKGL